MFAYEKNPDYSPKPYGHFIRRVALDYFKKRFYSPWNDNFWTMEKTSLWASKLTCFVNSPKPLLPQNSTTTTTTSIGNMEGSWTNMSFWVHQTTSIILTMCTRIQKVGNGIQWIYNYKVGYRKSKVCGKILQPQDQTSAIAYASLESRHASIHGWRCGVGAESGKSNGGEFIDKGEYWEICKVHRSRMTNIPTLLDFKK